MVRQFVVLTIVVVVAAIVLVTVGRAGIPPWPHFPLTVKGIVEDGADAPVADAQVLVYWFIAKGIPYVFAERVCVGVVSTRTDAGGAYEAAYPGSLLDFVPRPTEFGRWVSVRIYKPGFQAATAATSAGDTPYAKTERIRPDYIPVRATSGETPRQSLDRLAKLYRSIETCRGNELRFESALRPFYEDLFAEARPLARTAAEKGQVLGISEPLVRPFIRKAGWQPRERLTYEQVDLILNGRIDIVMAYAALKAAVKDGDGDKVAAMLAAGTDPNFDDGYSWSLLGHAIDNDSARVALALLKAGVRARPDEQSDILDRALYKSYVGVVEELLRQGIPLQVRGRSTSSLLLRAVVRSDAETVALLLRHGADPNALTPQGDTPLHRAKNPQIAAQLLASGADPNIADTMGETPLVAFVRTADADMVDALLRANADPDSTNRRGRPLIITASAGTDAEIVRSLLGHGADVNALYLKGRPVTMAAYKGNADIVRLLIESGADLDGAAGALALRYAAPSNLAIVRMLVEAGADVNAQYDPSYPAPLARAAYAGKSQIVNYLIGKGAVVDAYDEIGQSALMRAAGQGRTKSMGLLIAAGAAINAADSDGMTAIMYSIDAAFRRRMIAATEDKSDCPRAPAVQTTTAPRKNKPPVTREIPLNEDVPSHVEAQKSIVIVGSAGGATVVDAAIQPPYYCRKEPVNIEVEALRLLLAHDAALNGQETRYGWSALMMIAQVDAPSAADLLLSRGAERNQRNFAGDMAIDIAREAGSTRTVALLEKP